MSGCHDTNVKKQYCVDCDAIHMVAQKVIDAINQRTAHERPYKCPNCEGSGNRPDYVVGKVLFSKQPCLSCHGRGIVWK